MSVELRACDYSDVSSTLVTSTHKKDAGLMSLVWTVSFNMMYQNYSDDQRLSG